MSHKIRGSRLREVVGVPWGQGELPRGVDLWSSSRRLSLPTLWVAPAYRSQTRGPRHPFLHQNDLSMPFLVHIPSVVPYCPPISAQLLGLIHPPIPPLQPSPDFTSLQTRPLYSWCSLCWTHTSLPLCLSLPTPRLPLRLYATGKGLWLSDSYIMSFHPPISACSFLPRWSWVHPPARASEAGL